MRDPRAVVGQARNMAAAAQTLIPSIPMFFRRLKNLPYEQLEIAHFDGSRRLLGWSTPERGSAHAVDIPIRRIVADALALALDARGVILAHNHPSGDPAPSAEDICATQRLADTMHLLDIVVLDHLVIAGRRWRSFRRLGLI